jgi:hypothetical protein
MQIGPETTLAVAEYRIDWILHHPQTSDWLRQALRDVRAMDPVDAQNDVEMLRHLILPLAVAQIELALSSQLASNPGPDV